MRADETSADVHEFVITVGVDFSEQSRYALALARSIAQEHADVRVHAVHVAKLPGLSDSAVHLDVRRELERVREVCAPVLGELVRCTRCHVVIGQADLELVRFACDCGADLLIIGERQKSQLERLITGWRSSRIVRSATCSVLRAHEKDLAQHN
jgi:nucleotide-binding universal stress UspA family protein